MQNRYAGDIGDYIKLTILRRLSPGHRMGVIWWLHPDERHNADGKHIAYLTAPQKWRARDPHVFDRLRHLVNSGRRDVRSLEEADLLPGATFFNDPIPTRGRKAERRADGRAWFERAVRAVADCDLVFLDPDNGLETARFEPGARKAGKSVALAEVQALHQPGRTIVVYHHQTRMSGGHMVELHHWGHRLAELGFRVDALRASAFSARAFFLLDATPDMRAHAADLAHEWGDRLTWHPGLG